MEEIPDKKRRTTLLILGSVVLILLSVLIILQSSNLWKELSVETAGDTLLLYGLSSLNFIAFIVFGFIFLRSLVRLARERRSLTLGAKLRSRLFFYFTLVSILPIIAMAVFSYLFLNRALDRWFSQIPENAVRQAIEINDRSAEEEIARLHATAQMLAVSIGQESPTASELEKIAKSGNLSYIAILDPKKNILTEWLADPAAASSDEIVALRRGFLEDSSLADRNGLEAATATLSNGNILVIVPDLGETAASKKLFSSALSEFDRLKDQQLTVRQIGFLTLGLLTFLLIFASSWTAFYVARGLTVPVKALAEGAERISQGEMGYKVDVIAEDELAILVASFNQMSEKLAQNASELAERRRYIETILLSLPSGVISFDAKGTLSTINPAARSILRINAIEAIGTHFEELLANEAGREFSRIIRRAQRVGLATGQIKLKFQDAAETVPLALTATALADNAGVVVVIEDLSELLAAQKAAAWQEVARRMAHEIKNPLTPIQLSAERIARRFSNLEKVQGAETNGIAEITDEELKDKQLKEIIFSSTETILSEVRSLKSLVDEFSRFARLPEITLVDRDLNEILDQVETLYNGREAEAEIIFRKESGLPLLPLDAEQIKRAMVNLIDNAIEAPCYNNEKKKIIVTSRLENNRDSVILEIADNGAGIDSQDQKKLFQPYFSTKQRGTGLGLAIVHKIVTDHGARIFVDKNHPHGAKFTIEFQLTA
jgi:nitrogen fixation/metabolism regulation signal transduction histidine kinase